jgi:hypothetical protein
MAKIKTNQGLTMQKNFGHKKGILGRSHNFGILGFDLIKLELGKIT